MNWDWGKSKAPRDGRRISRELVGGNDQLGVGVAAHPVDSAGGASTDGVGVAARMLSGDGDRAIGATQDGTVVVERIVAAEVDDKAGAPRAAHKSDAGADFNTKGFVGLGVRNARGRCGMSGSAAPDVDGTGRRSGTAGVRCVTNTGRIGIRADVALNFLLCVRASDETSQEKWQDEQTTKSC